MEDILYLLQTVQRGCICPVCRNEYLRNQERDKIMEAGEAFLYIAGAPPFPFLDKCRSICKGCGVIFTTFRDLFIAIAQDCKWGKGAWDTWKMSHPEYEPPPKGK